MRESDRDLIVRLATGPRFLFLGQESWKDRDYPGQTSHADVILPPFESSSAADLRKVDAEIESCAPPLWLAQVSTLPWNGIFTSRIDSHVAGVFETDWRRAIATNKAQLGRYPRSSSELIVRMLFGGVALPPDEQPPADILQAAEAEQQANETMAALASSILTPRGVLVIEGWDPSDWFNAKQMFSFLARLSPGRAHLFSATPAVASDPYIKAAVEKRLLNVHDEPLESFLGSAADQGLIDMFHPGDTTSPAKLIPVGNGFEELDIDSWNQVTNSARPVDLDLLEPFHHSSPELRYQRFRTFLSSADGAPPWKAIASGFKLARDFEATLKGRVLAALKDPFGAEPIIVAGQTATGKSMALCQLALDTARSGEAVVLHQSRRRDRPNLTDVDAFAQWAERIGADATVLIWDGMVDPEEYHSLHRQLRSRGRRVLIVGSTYSQGDLSANVIPAPAAMSKQEAARTREWLAAFGIQAGQIHPPTDSSFLALLYRWLPDTEQGLRKGLSLEARAVESRLEVLAQQPLVTRESRLGAIAQALADAGVEIHQFSPSDRPHEELIALQFAQRSTAERLTALILVASRRGTPLPVELAMRVVGKDGVQQIVNLVKNFDMFRWTEDENDNQFLSARTVLEAELLAREELSPEGEVDVICQLIEVLRIDDSRNGGGEVQFIVDVIDRIGPQSDETGRYWRFYRRMADSFAQLRDTSARRHSRLVLQEANLLREFVHRSHIAEELSLQERMEILRGVQSLLNDEILDSEASPRTRLNLLVELASSIGSQVFELGATSDPSADDLQDLMASVISVTNKARSIDPENIYPIDVIAWSTEKAVESGALDPSRKLDMLANAVASLESLNVDGLTPRQRADYDRRGVTLSRLRGDTTLEIEHLVSLMNNGDPAAYYFLAKDAASSQDRGALDTAVEVLQSAPSTIRDDWRCAGLLLDLFWQKNAGARLLRGERQTIPFSQAIWEECLAMLDQIPNVSGYDRHRAEFVRGLALFHLGSQNASKAVFSQLDQASADLSSRIVAKYLASDAAGNPLVYTGRVSWANTDGRRGSVWVDQLNAEINFVPLYFSISELRQKGESLPRFHIAFSMRGARADPITRIGSTHSSGRSDVQ